MLPVDFENGIFRVLSNSHIAQNFSSTYYTCAVFRRYESSCDASNGIDPKICTDTMNTETFCVYIYKENSYINQKQKKKQIIG